jgi:8-oxo-dGTP diphosphatase
MTAYVAGFLFDDTGSRVALVRKARPEWQAGRLNGVGGHLEPGETGAQAMRREFWEEAGVDLTCWEPFATVEGVWGSVEFFRAFSTTALDEVSTRTEEPIEVVHALPRSDNLPNLSWLIPLARYTHDRYAPVVATEVCGCGGRIVPETNRGVEHHICTACSACPQCELGADGDH